LVAVAVVERAVVEPVGRLRFSVFVLAGLVVAMRFLGFFGGKKEPTEVVRQKGGVRLALSAWNC
jgi:hypothetical protein